MWVSIFLAYFLWIVYSTFKGDVRIVFFGESKESKESKESFSVLDSYCHESSGEPLNPMNIKPNEIMKVGMSDFGGKF